MPDIPGHVSEIEIEYYSVAFSLSNTRVFFSIFVFSISVIIRVVHLMEQFSVGTLITHIRSKTQTLDLSGYIHYLNRPLATTAGLKK